MIPTDFSALRQGLARLPRADNHAPGAPVEPNTILIVPGHRAALDPDRALVVGNRGMGKSFWAHALAEPAARETAAATFRELATTDVRIGFNAAERSDSFAPTPSALQDAMRAQLEPEAVWRAVLVRVASSEGVTVPSSAAALDSFKGLVEWVQSNGEAVDRLLTELDNRLVSSSKKLLIVFDALDRLATDWETTRKLTAALLRRALAVRSYRSLRLKLFMRRDQFEDPSLFEFPDGSKIKNTRVDLEWSSADLYTLLFSRLAQEPVSKDALASLRATIRSGDGLSLGAGTEGDKLLVDAMAGEYMGSGEKRGRVFTWVPLHLADARGETSPRTFLTAWREAAHHAPVPIDRAVDHLGLLEGVRKASEDRLQELREDYWWIDRALEPLRDQLVPMERGVLEELWRTGHTATTILDESKKRAKLAPVQLGDSRKDAAASLVDALVSIGVLEIRPNGKVNVPDIFRVEAGIKRKGGVKPPRRSPAEGR